MALTKSRKIFRCSGDAMALAYRLLSQIFHFFERQGFARLIHDQQEAISKGPR